MKRLLFVFIDIILLLSTVLTSCGKVGEDTAAKVLLSELSSYYAESSDNAAEQSSLKFVIVIPDGCGAEVFEAAVLLSQSVSKKVGYTVECKYDTDLSVSKNNFEVIVGRTSRKSSAEYLRSLRSYDYGYAVLGDCITVGAHDDGRMSLALRMLVDDIENGKVSLGALSSLTKREERAEYDVTELKLNGFELSEYTIVYPKSSKLGEIETAQRLARLLEDGFGYSLEVANDSKVSASARKICVGKTKFFEGTDAFSDPSSAAVCGTPAAIHLMSGSSYGLRKAAARLCDELSGSVREGIGSLDILRANTFSFDDSDISLMIFDVPKASFGVTDYKLITDAFAINNFSSAVFNSFSRVAIFNVRNNIGDTFESVSSNADVYFDNGGFISKGYATEDVAGGTVFCYTLERLSDNAEFAYIGALARSGASDEEKTALTELLLDVLAENSGRSVILYNNFSLQDDVALSSSGLSKAFGSPALNIYVSSDKMLVSECYGKTITAGISGAVLKFKVSPLY